MAANVSNNVSNNVSINDNNVYELEPLSLSPIDDGAPPASSSSAPPPPASPTTANLPRRRSVAGFLLKTYEIFNNPKNAQYCSWGAKGGERRGNNENRRKSL